MAKLNPSNNPNKASTAERTVPLSLSPSDFFRAARQAHAPCELGKTDEQNHDSNKNNPWFANIRPNI
jgi:hypothetical protein